MNEPTRAEDYANTAHTKHAAATASPLRKNLVILGIVAVALTCLLSFNARLDTTLWRATRWLMGDQQPYSWAAVKLNPATHPHAPWWRVTPPLFHSQLYHHLFHDFSTAAVTIGPCNMCRRLYAVGNF